MKLSTTTIEDINTQLANQIAKQLDGLEDGHYEELGSIQIDANEIDLDVQVDYSISIDSKCCVEGSRMTQAEYETNILIEVHNVEVFNEDGKDLIEQEDKHAFILEHSTEYTELN